MANVLVKPMPDEEIKDFTPAPEDQVPDSASWLVDDKYPSPPNTLLRDAGQAPMERSAVTYAPLAPEAPAPVSDLSTTPSEFTPNVLTKRAMPADTPLPSLELPTDEYSKYWGQRIGFDGQGVPLDMLVRLAGSAAHALDPKGFGGMLGKDLAQMGHEAYTERNRREYDYPNKLLQRRLAIAQIRKAEADEPGAWDAYWAKAQKAGIPVDQAIAEFTSLTTKERPSYHFVQSDTGEVSVFRDGMLMSGTGKGKDISNEIAHLVTDDKGNVRAYSKTMKYLGTLPFPGKTNQGTTVQAPGNKLSKTGTNAKGETINVMQDGSRWVMRGKKWEAATDEDMVGTTWTPTKKTSFLDELNKLGAEVPTGAVKGSAIIKGQRVEVYMLNGKVYEVGTNKERPDIKVKAGE